MISKNCLLGIFVLLLAGVNVVKAFNTERVSEIPTELQKLLESNPELKALGERIKEHSDSLIDAMSERELLEFLVNYQNLMTLFFKLGTTVGNEMESGNSDDKIWATFDKEHEAAKSEKYYQSMGDIIGKENMEEIFKDLKVVLQEFLVKLKEDPTKKELV